MDRIASTEVRELLEWPRLISHLVSRCKTESGKKLASSLEPLDLPEARSQMAEITEMKEFIIQVSRLDFQGINNIMPVLDRARRQAVLSLEELSDIRAFIKGSQRLKKFLNENIEHFNFFQKKIDTLMPLKEIGECIIPAITDEKELSQSRFPQLKKLIRSIAAKRKEIEKALNQIINSGDMQNVLQERTHTTVSQRHVILIKAGMKHRIAGTVHDSSSSGATVYFEPDSIRHMNDSLVAMRIELQQEITRILAELSETVNEHEAELAANLNAISYIDLIHGSAILSTDIKGNEIELTDNPMLSLIKARHPLLELMQPGGVVSNDLRLGEESRCLVVSGANTGGKTVILKTTGLCSLMAACGLHIPAAADSRAGIFKKILADLGDDQNLEKSLSTFSGQIVAIRDMLAIADKSSLVLIDEIIVGTNPRQGAAIAQAILEELGSTGCCMLITTHYTELSALAAEDNRFQNASVSFDLKSLRPTYRLITGVPGGSFAMEIAKNYGLPETVTSRAKELLDESETSLEALLDRVQNYEQEIAQNKQNLEELNTRLKQERHEYKLKKEHYEKMLKEKQLDDTADLILKLTDMREQVSKRITELQSLDMKEASSLQKEIISLQKEAADAFGTFKNDIDKSTSTKPEAGDTVIIQSLNIKGVVEEISPDGDTAIVLIGSSVRSRFKPAELTVINLSEKNKTRNMAPAHTENKAGNESRPLTLQTSYNTIDLRGKRVDEALIIMDRELDRMGRSGIQTAIVIHGHGTGALKEAVRQQLRVSFYANNFRPGKMGEGGDGVTIVFLN